MAFFAKLFRIKKLRRRPSNNQVGVVVDQKAEDGDGSSAKIYSWDDIETFTNNFSVVIGSGGFSNVYLARLPGSTHPQGAIKILNQVFQQELDILLRLCHENIVKFLGYCNDKDEGALVFEYVPNGSLHEKLHGGSKRMEGQLLTSLAAAVLKDVSECESKKVKEMVDPLLGGEFDLEEARIMLSISELCLRQAPIHRPSATEILHTMEDKIFSQQTKIHNISNAAYLRNGHGKCNFGARRCFCCKSQLGLAVVAGLPPVTSASYRVLLLGGGHVVAKSGSKGSLFAGLTGAALTASVVVKGVIVRFSNLQGITGLYLGSQGCICQVFQPAGSCRCLGLLASLFTIELPHLS
ncbi:hypothetical protein Pint_14960 [Pistacia integerrima]|uniref:Uncharacterized protein n=1 Tax=Pistacia integerrima TaxID=434235 RepID=A0ACC0ZB78_9ROSI|nr:hypothetical protein Pint_14960 [Pistacia integerrima]